jgi:predicted nucleic acid-binding protein
MILVDSNFFIALINEKDQSYKRAKELLNDMMREDYKIVPLLMLSEAITSIGKRKKGKASTKLYNVINDNFNVYYPEKEDIEETMELVLKYNGTLSLADCLAVHIMKQKNITNIYSFNSDFDKVKGIQRIY